MREILPDIGRRRARRDGKVALATVVATRGSDREELVRFTRGR